MHSTLVAIRDKLAQLVTQVQGAIPNNEPFGNAHNNWSFPGLTKSELLEAAQSLVDLINERGGDDIGQTDAQLKDYVRRVEFLRASTAGQLWPQAGPAVSAYMLTLNGLRKALEPALKPDDLAEVARSQRRQVARVRAMEARLQELEPRTAALAEMVDRIENAHSTADQLPTDLASLAEAREKIGRLLGEATKDGKGIADILERSGEVDKQLANSVAEAGRVLERCETAYSAATSVGLAAAFAERSAALARSMWIWVGGLIMALAAGLYFGGERLHILGDLLKDQNVSSSLLSLNLALSLVSLAAPVWFAWLATKQIGQRFRLAEDYAFKASISRAYEGFRREAARFDKDMEARLLGSALSRLDELPLRLVETASHGSPWHELASSEVIREAVKAVPGFTEQVKDLAVRAMGAVSAGPKAEGGTATGGEKAA
jgi:hypothetical protein